MQVLSGIQPLTIQHLENCTDRCESTIPVWKDGWAVSMMTGALVGHPIWDDIVQKKSFMLSSLVVRHGAIESRLYMSLRVLCGLGWLGYRELHGGRDVLFFHTPKSQYMFRYAPALLEASMACSLWSDFDSLKHSEWEPTQKMTFLRLQQFVQQERLKAEHESADSVQKYVALCVESCLALPILRLLQGVELSGEAGQWLEQIKNSCNPETMSLLMSSFKTLGWVERKDDSFSFTTCGAFYISNTQKISDVSSRIPSWLEFSTLCFSDANGYGQTGNDGDYQWLPKENEDPYIKLAEAVTEKIITALPTPKGICFSQASDPSAILAVKRQLDASGHSGLIYLVTHHNPSVVLNLRDAFVGAQELGIVAIESQANDPEGLQKRIERDHATDLRSMLHVQLSSASQRVVSNQELQQTVEVPVIPTGIYCLGQKRVSASQSQISLINYLKEWNPYFAHHGALIFENHIDMSADKHEYKVGDLYTCIDAAMSGRFISDAKSFENALQLAGLMIYSNTSIGDVRSGALRYVKP